MLLPMAMNEAAFQWKNPYGKPQHQNAQFVMFASECTKIECFLQLKEGLRCPPITQKNAINQI